MIKHFHFKAWPDKSVPDTAWPIVQFWRAVTEEVAKDAKPILVHCRYYNLEISIKVQGNKSKNFLDGVSPGSSFSHTYLEMTGTVR